MRLGELDCPICGKEFDTLGRLTNHLRIHQYKCPYCHRAYDTEGDLKIHMGIVHPMQHGFENQRIVGPKPVKQKSKSWY